jgi:hypothetical protein
MYQELQALDEIEKCYYDLTKKQVVVLEDGKPLFAWVYPEVDYSNLSEALSQFYPDASIVVNEIQGGVYPNEAKWFGVVNGVAHAYKIVALKFIY